MDVKVEHDIYGTNGKELYYAAANFLVALGTTNSKFHFAELKVTEGGQLYVHVEFTASAIHVHSIMKALYSTPTHDEVVEDIKELV